MTTSMWSGTRSWGPQGQALERETRELLDAWEQVRREVLELIRQGR